MYKKNSLTIYECIYLSADTRASRQISLEINIKHFRSAGGGPGGNFIFRHLRSCLGRTCKLMTNLAEEQKPSDLSWKIRTILWRVRSQRGLISKPIEWEKLFDKHEVKVGENAEATGVRVERQSFVKSFFSSVNTTSKYTSKLHTPQWTHTNSLKQKLYFF